MKRNSKTNWVWPIAALTLAFVVRAWGVQHDLPYSYLGDEQHFVKRSLSFGSGDLNPHWFHKPAFYMYVLFFEYGLYFCFGWIFGSWSSPDEFAVTFVENPFAFYLIGRLTTVALAVLTIAGVYRIGEKHCWKYSGVFAAFLLALAYGHVESSRVIKADVPSACFSVWAMFFVLDYLKDGRKRSILIASALTGLGAATKDYAILMLAPIIGAALLQRLPRENTNPALQARGPANRLGLATLAILMYASTYFIGTPYNILDARGREWTAKPFVRLATRAQRLFAGGETENAPAEPRHAQPPDGSTNVGEVGLAYVGTICSKYGMGVVIGPLGLAGAILGLFSRDRRRVLLCLYVFLFIFISVFAFSNHDQPRHQVPLYPFLALTGGGLVALVASSVGQRARIVHVGLCIALILPFAHIMERSITLSRESTRNVSKEWIESNIPAGAKIVISENGPNLLPSEECIGAMIDAASEESDDDGQFTAHYDKYLDLQRKAAARGTAYDLHEIRLPWWRSEFTEDGIHTLDSERDRDMGNPLRPVGVEDYDHYVESGFQYAVVHSDHYGRFGDPEKAERFPSYARFYAELFEHGELLQEISAERRGLRGPDVRIFRFVPRQVK